MALSPKKFSDALLEVFVSSSELSKLVSRGVRDGSLRRLGAKVYTRNLSDPPEAIVARHRWQLISELVPGALIADRTALEMKPAADGSIFVVSEHKRDIELPGLIVRPRRGPGPLPTDKPFIGRLFCSAEARAFLDNMAASRQRGRKVRRTLTREEIEARLDEKIRYHGGTDALNRLRDAARTIAPMLGREAEFAAFDRIVAGLLRTHDVPLASAVGRARQAGAPYDPERMQRFEVLFRELRGTAPFAREARGRTLDGRTNLAFFEAYFSNYIEGTKFAVAEAAHIIFDGVIPQSRPADAHDIAGTWRVVSDPTEMSRLPKDPAALVELLRRRHATVMNGRPDMHPGVFKIQPNQAGSTMFVAPELVEGTLRQGFDLYRGLDTPFARAVYMMFLVSEVHPFTDGNGRTARLMMNAELVAAGEERIIIPTVLRDNYIDALKALSRARNPEPIVRTLDYAQRWVAAIDWRGLTETTAELERCHAFLEPHEAELRGVRLRVPDPAWGGNARS